MQQFEGLKQMFSLVWLGLLILRQLRTQQSTNPSNQPILQNIESKTNIAMSRQQHLHANAKQMTCSLHEKTLLCSHAV